MSEFWDFYATRGPIDEVLAAARRKRLRAVVAAASEVGGREPSWVYVYAEGKQVARLGELVLYFFDHKGAAWSFELWRSGESIGQGTFGENPETGAEDEGFEGDLEATAAALGVPVEKLEKTFASPDSSKFLRLLGLSLPPFGISELLRDAPKGVSRLSDTGDD